MATILLLGPGFLLLSQLWSLASTTFGVAVPYWLAVDRHTLVLVAIGLMPGLAAALTGYVERLALNPQVRQYDRMRELFERAYHLLPVKVDGSTSARVRQVYRELGMEAMKENAEWVAIYRQRPIQPLQQ